MGTDFDLRRFCAVSRDGKPGPARISHMTDRGIQMKLTHFFLVIMMAMACAATILTSDTLSANNGQTDQIKITQL